MDLSTIRTKLKNQGIKITSSDCDKWLLENGYVYNPAFGWELISVIESFALNPNMSGIPMVLKPLWVEKSGGGNFTDSYGNKIKAESGRTEWIQHPEKKEWYPSDNWLAYLGFRKDRNNKTMARENVPLPVE